ncbi:conserved hypothetical protein [Culex quinquefasciatus]|uniref:CRAL-TRIO domain-containing protein n=1 Tax=Culex quinquefasciatus TaxID=7176 RepID=B0X422_CULQU|nr:clavesin-2-like isoform X1 [Culex pipiens pallens]EDS26694.1 conserved hypothetical protein [Culex quinquefasciatus]EDS40099.1 conserved hypothetical protein [Culex quinquefasciatus]|eukprot:XP_001864394.1 conserved hypothetical protein [Culex quinquefasciatus]
MVSVPGVEKRPASYDSYKTTLDAKCLAVARQELHEDDHTREPALAQFREFIAKHPQIVRCRTDSLFLLRFLRRHKFNVLAACEMLERYLETLQTASDFFGKLDPQTLAPLIRDRVMVPLGQDQQGRLLVTIRFGEFDPKTTTAEQLSQLIATVMETHLDQERFQVNGIVLIVDFLAATMAHFGIWTLPKLKLVMSATDDILAFRVKEIHLVQLPKFAAMVADFCIAALSPKLQQRIRFHKTLDTLKDDIDPEVLPTIYGGKQSLEEANEKFHKLALSQRDRFLKQAEMYIDLSIPAPNAKNANAALQSSVADESVIGSFRKLNVD